MTRPSVLLADDDDGVRFTLSEVLSELDVDLVEARDGREAWEQFQKSDFDLVITDLKMPEMDGMELLGRIHEQKPETKVVMITAHGSEAAAVQAMKLGAFDYFPKPFDVDEVADVVERATETVRLTYENRMLRAALALGRHMVFRSEKMARVAQLVERVAPRDVTILLQGESGTGKELVANAIVSASKREAKPFIKFNCAAIPREIAEAELFGHTSGAFTGADKPRPGIFRRAHQGTLFLDEVAELDLVVQGKLLRVLQEGELRPVGHDEPLVVDVRIVAATHTDLQQAVSQGTFREDLFYRLNVVRIDIPPLRERPEDLEPLIDHFLKKYAERFGLANPRLGTHARARLLSTEYKGNVRELENAIERLVALSSDETIEDLDAPTTASGEPLGLKDRVEAFERGLILAELGRTGWNRSEASRHLRIGRVTLLDKMKKLGITAPGGE